MRLVQRMQTVAYAATAGDLFPSIGWSCMKPTAGDTCGSAKSAVSCCGLAQRKRGCTVTAIYAGSKSGMTKPVKDATTRRGTLLFNASAELQQRIMPACASTGTPKWAIAPCACSSVDFATISSRWARHQATQWMCAMGCLGTRPGAGTGPRYAPAAAADTASRTTPSTLRCLRGAE